MLPRKVVAFLFLCASALPLLGQQHAPATFNLDTDREPMMSLDGTWRFHPGDDLRWAQPSFDDSAWALIRGDRGWSAQGYEGLAGIAWYRARVVIPAGTPALALLIPRFQVRTNYQVYIDGRLSTGCSSARVDAARMPQTRMCQLSEPSAGDRTIELAIRVWQFPFWARFNPGGINGGLRIGSLTTLELYATQQTLALSWKVTAFDVITILYLLAGFSALAFYLLRHREKEYAWFAAFALLSAAFTAWRTYYAFHEMGIWPQNVVENLIGLAQALSLVGFLYHLFRPRRDWLFRLAIASACITMLLFVAAAVGGVGPVPLLWGGMILPLPFLVWQFYVLIPAAHSGFADARFLLLPALLGPMAGFTQDILILLQQAGWYRGPATWFNATSTWPFPFNFTNLSDFVFLIAMVAILITRLNRISTEQERLAAELEAARTVQQILIPEEIPSIPGFAIESVYKPAAQVGGDFFQILPTSAGGVLAVIGDVSGKGMPAAMTVSLLVGTVRTLAESTNSPAAILARMNQRMLGRTQGGFTTCLVARADADGTLTMANAGHLAPYVNGREIELESGLPLGISPEAKYHETTLRIQAGSQVTLLTDGVAEARNQAGELFGFERTASLASKAAASIAGTAREFGQEDDITVLTLALTQAEVLA